MEHLWNDIKKGNPNYSEIRLNVNIFTVYPRWMDLDSSPGIVTVYGLDGPRIESRWGVRFSAPVQTSSGTELSSYKVGTGSISRG